MEKFTPNYSLKNIPHPLKPQFIQDLTDKIIDFIKRIQWKAFFFLTWNEHMKEEIPELKGSP